MELSHFWRAISRHWKVAVGVFGLTLLGAGYLAYSPPDSYQATTTILIEPSRPEDLATVNFLIPALQVQLGTAVTARSASSFVDPDVRDSAVSVSSAVEPGTGVMTVTAVGSEPAAVAPWANAYADAISTSRQTDSPLRIRVIDPAVTPDGPSGPERTSTIVSGAVLGLIIAVAAALFAHALTQRRSLSREVRRRFGVPVLGEIPWLQVTAEHAPGSATLSRHADVVEPIMLVRANLESQLATRPTSSICVTSTESGEGKTLVVGALAHALASVGHQISVIEADLRRASPRFWPGPAAQAGATASATQATTTAAAARTPSLTVIGAAELVGIAESETSASRGAMHPSEVVSLALPLALRRLERDNGLVLVDSPPLGEEAEASVVARLAGGVILVLDASRRHHLDTLEKGLARVDESGGTVLGVVLTRTRRGGLLGSARRAPAADAGDDSV